MLASSAPLTSASDGCKRAQGSGARSLNVSHSNNLHTHLNPREVGSWGERQVRTSSSPPQLSSPSTPSAPGGRMLIASPVGTNMPS